MSNTKVMTECQLHPATRDKIREIAAEIFQMKARDIDLKMGPDDVDRWDSLNHLRLITEVESAFSLRLTMQQIQQINTLEDLARCASDGAA